jgi:hypothetical protein
LRRIQIEITDWDFIEVEGMGGREGLMGGVVGIRMREEFLLEWKV